MRNQRWREGGLWRRSGGRAEENVVVCVNMVVCVNVCVGVGVIVVVVVAVALCVGVVVCVNVGVGVIVCGCGCVRVGWAGSRHGCLLDGQGQRREMDSVC